MISLPFLYLPDALSLTLLFIALTLLRLSAIAHLRQELVRLRKQMVLDCATGQVPASSAGYVQLRTLLVEASEFAPRLSPAHLFFVHREAARWRFNDQPAAATTESRGDQRACETKLLRLRLDMHLAIGTYFLLGSISGWILSCLILIRISYRKLNGTSTQPAFDLAEKLISRSGFEALKLAQLLNATQRG